MPTLEKCKKEIERLVVAKGFANRREFAYLKVFCAFLELGEAGNLLKKGESEEEIGEELVDAIFYILDGSRLACPSVNMDEMFLRKLKQNWMREYQYGIGSDYKEIIAKRGGKKD